MIVREEEDWLSHQQFRDRKSVIKNKYDKKNRLVTSEYKGWDNNKEIAQIRIEEFEYLKNRFIYKYKQSLKREGGKDKRPLQYELTYTFY